MINGAHAIIYTKNPEADRAFFRDIIGMPHVDVGEGWLIFGLPPSEVAFHPTEDSAHHEFYLLTADVAAFCEAMKAEGVPTSPPEDKGWGVLTFVTLPGGGHEWTGGP